MDARDLWLAIALVLIIEGLLPFASPGGWREAFTRLLALSDGQLRFFGCCCIAGGLLLLLVTA